MPNNHLAINLIMDYLTANEVFKESRGDGDEKLLEETTKV